MNDDDELIRRHLADYAYAKSELPDITSIRNRMARDRRRRTAARIAAAAVVVMLIGAVTAVILSSRGTQVQPIAPSPEPTLTSTSDPDPTPTGTTTPSPSPTLPFNEQGRDTNGLPSGGLGDVIEGIRLDGITFTETSCPDANRCPDTASLTISNTTSSPTGGQLIFTVYRNGQPAVGEGAVFALEPGQATTLTITLQPGLADNAPVGRRGSLYTWNFAVELN